MNKQNQTPRETNFIAGVGFVLAWVIQANIASAQSCVPPPAGLVSWWRGQDDATDFVGTNNGIIHGGVTFTEGEVGTAFLLNGTDGYIEVPDSPSLNPSDQITVEAWYRPVSFSGPGNSPIVVKSYSSYGMPYYQYNLDVIGDQHGGAYAAVFEFWVAVGGQIVVADTPNNAWVAGNWYHIAGTYDGSAVKIYVNGALINQISASGGIPDYGEPLFIGRSPFFDGPNYRTPGTIDEVSLYNRALSASEVASLYAAGSAGKCASPPTNSPPTISVQPQSHTNAVGSNATLSIIARGTAPLAYQWLSNSVPLADGGRVVGASSNRLTISNLQVSDSANYSAVVSNAFGTVLSSNAFLTVTTNLTWTGAISSDWNNPANWNPPMAPTASNHVVINSGNVTVPPDASFAVMDWSGGTISGSLGIAPGAVMNWSGGIASGSLTVASNGVMNISGTVALYSSSALTNAGTVNWQAGSVIVRGSSCLGYYAFIENLPGALWDIQCDQQMYNDYGCGTVTSYFHNAGTVRKSAGAGTTDINIPYSGPATVSQGTLNLNGGGIIDGSSGAATGTTINFNGNYTSGAAPVLIGPGAFRFTGGTLMLLSNVIPNLQMLGGYVVLGPGFQGGTIINLTLAGTILSGDYIVSGALSCGNGFSGSLQVASNAVMNWSGGIAYGSLTVASNGVMNISGTVALYSSSALTNAGTVNWQAGSVIVRGSSCLGYYAFIENLPGALWDIQCDQQMYNDYGCGTVTSYFHNAGTMRKSAGAGTTDINILYSGPATVLQGTLNLNGGGTIDGSFGTATGTTINFNGNYTSGAAPVLTGPGAFRFTGGTLTLLSNVIPNLQMLGGYVVLGPGFQGGTIINLTLAGTILSGDYIVSGALSCGNGFSGSLRVASNAVMNWSGGIASGSLTVASNGVMNISGTVALYSSSALTNAGTVNWQAGSVIVRGSSCLGYYAFIENLPGALWDIQCDQQMYNDYGCGTVTSYFHNAGTMRKSAGAGTTDINILYSGPATVLQGTLNLNGGGTIDGSFGTATGTTINFNGNYTSGAAPVLTGPGAFRFTGGTLTLLSNVIPNLQMLGGYVVLGPGFQGGTIVNLTLAGTILSGDYIVSGALSCGNGFSGSLRVASNAVMNWSGGIASGSLTVASNGVMNISGTVALYSSSALTNAGTVNWQAGSVIVRGSSCLGYYAFIENLPGALWDIQCDQQMYNDYGCGTVTSYFHNAGTMRKSAGAGTTDINILYSGPATVLQGTLNLNGGGTIDGSFGTATGTTINFNGNYTSGAAPVLTGPGAFRFTGGTLTLLSNVIPNLQMLGGYVVLGPGFQGGTIVNLTLVGTILSGDYIVSGALSCGNGFSGSLRVASNAVMNWSGGIASGSLTVASNGVMNISGTVALYSSSALTNAGTVNWQAGSVIVRGSSCLGYYAFIENLPGALWDIQCDQQMYNDYGCGTVTSYFHNAGTMRKSAGAGTTDINIPLYNSGIVAALQGTLSFNGGFNPTGGELLFGLSSLADFGRINIPGNATLDGTLGVAWLHGFVPATNDTFTVLTYGSYSGIFTNLDLPPAALWETNYLATSFNVRVADINKLAFTTQPVSGKIPGGILPSVVVQIEHPIGDPVASNGVPVTLALNSGYGHLSGTLTRTTDSAGKATFNDLSIDRIGLKTLRASAPNLTPATCIEFKIVPIVEVEPEPAGVLLRLNGPNNHGVITISASTDLKSWTPISTNAPSAGPIEFLDTNATNYPHRFYRIIEQ